MAGHSSQKSKKQAEAQRFEKSKKKATKTYVDQSWNVVERIMSHGEESASTRQEYYENRAEEANANFDTAWEQASGSNK